ncbi:hypothetical protein JXQ31_13080 [candidate division KSB1 bacterium]|nr:hypothetical protein [candidate division KSB1 bacterium]
MENILCYFYSTIPQILSGAIGLFGVFCLYKLKLISDSLKGLTESMVLELEIGEYYEEIKKDKDIKKLFSLHIRRLRIAATQSNIYKMKKALDDSYDFIKNLVPNTKMIEQVINPFENQVKTRNKLILHTKIALIFTGLLIFISTLIIPNLKTILTICPHSSIDQNNCLSILLLIIVLSLFILNLIIIIVIVFKSLDTYNELRNI